MLYSTHTYRSNAMAGYWIGIENQYGTKWNRTPIVHIVCTCCTINDTIEVRATIYVRSEFGQKKAKHKVNFSIRALWVRGIDCTMLRSVACVWCTLHSHVSICHQFIALSLSLAHICFETKIVSTDGWGAKPLTTFGKNEIGQEFKQHSILSSGILYCISIVRAQCPHLPHWMTKLQVDCESVKHA